MTHMQFSTKSSLFPKIIKPYV